MNSTNNGPARSALSKAQLAYHWRLWKQVCIKQNLQGLTTAQLNARRHAIYRQALGRDASISNNGGPHASGFTNKDLDLVLAAFRLIISGHTHVASQVALDHPDHGEQKRRLHVIKNIQPRLLALYVEDPFAYIEKIMADRFHITNGMRPLEDLHLHELDMLRSTVARAIDRLRHKAGHTVHDMYQAARLPCPPATACRKCALARVATPALNHTVPA